MPEWALVEIEDGNFKVLLQGTRFDCLKEGKKFGTPVDIIHGGGAIEIGRDTDPKYWQVIRSENLKD